MIVDRIMQYLGGERAAANEKIIAAAIQAIQRSLTRNMTNHKDEERKYLSASSSWYCARRILYGIRGAPRSAFAPRARMAFLMGDMLEATGVLLARLSEVPILSPNLIDGKQEEHVLNIDGTLIYCHLDMTIKGPDGTTEIPVDWKSMADYGFKEFEAAVRDPNAKWWAEERWGYLTQLRIYMLAKGAPFGLFVAVNKNTGNMAQLTVLPDPEWEKEWKDRVRKVAGLIPTATVPPRPAFATITRKDGKNLRPDGSEGPVEQIENWRCSYCPFLSTCFPDFGLVPLKSGPVWRRAVEPQPTTTAKEGAA